MFFFTLKLINKCIGITICVKKNSLNLSRPNTVKITETKESLQNISKVAFVSYIYTNNSYNMVAHEGGTLNTTMSTLISFKSRYRRKSKRVFPFYLTKVQRLD